MGQFKWTTCKPVIARIVNNIRKIDFEYYSSLPMWVGEAVMKMNTHYTMELRTESLKVTFHRATMPCIAETFGGLVYKGRRLKVSDISGPIGGMRIDDNVDNLFQSNVTPKTDSEINTVQENSYFTSTIDKFNSLPYDNQHYYRLNYNKIETSIEDGEVLLYFWALPKDLEGFPMIPDNEDYKTAIYWYVRMMMIGAGYEDKVFKYGDCEDRWRTYSVRAMNQISYPSVDEAQRTMEMTTGLIPNLYAWDSFGANINTSFNI